jgi:hypothetical protein
MQSKGWVKLWREQFTHEVSERKPWCDGYAWSYLYSQANYKPGVTNFRNQYITVDRGQFITSKLKLREIFGWSKKRINSFLTSLEVRGMCAIRVTNRFIMITICNYEKFQSTEDEKEPTDRSTEGPTESQQRATIKEVKEVKNIGRSKKQTDPRVKEFLNYWGETFQKETGQPYVFSFGKDGNLIKNLLAVHDSSTLQDLTKTFFKDEQCKRRGLTIGIFYQEINRLLSLKVMNPLEQAKREWAMQRGEKGNGVSS